MGNWRFHPGDFQYMVQKLMLMKSTLADEDLGFGLYLRIKKCIV